MSTAALLIGSPPGLATYAAGCGTGDARGIVAQTVRFITRSSYAVRDLGAFDVGFAELPIDTSMLQPSRSRCRLVQDAARSSAVR